MVLNGDCFSMEEKSVLDQMSISVGESLNEDGFERAVRYIEGLYYRKAIKQICQVLKADRRNAGAWLWYSRIVTDTGQIKKALANALLLAPSDIGIKREINRFRFARKLLTEGAISRCPFCWVPLNTGSDSCVSCNSVLAIPHGTKEIWPDRSILHEAQARYRRVIAVDQKNAKAHYYLGLANFNLGRRNLSIENFYRAEDSAPLTPFFARQRSLLQQLLMTGNDFP